MRLQLLAILLVSLVAAATADEHWFFNSDAEYSAENAKGCCLPKQWEGKVGVFYMRKRIAMPSIRMASSKVGIDYKNQKAGAKSMIFCPFRKRTYAVKSVVDFAAKKAYSIYNGKCKAYDVTAAALPDNCIPGKFSKLTPYYYGAGSSQLSLSPYGYRDDKLEYFIAVASGNCAPVKGAFRTRYYKRTKSIGKYQYYNITIGNKDADLYSVPANCTTATYEMPRFRRFFRRFLTFNEHPLPEDSDFSSVSEEPLSPLHKMLVGHANVLLNDGSRNCRWCRRVGEIGRRGWGGMRRGWDQFGNGWNRFRDGI